MKLINSIDFLIGLDYHHISFDLWLTLIKSNPNYKLKRNQLFKDFFEIDSDIEIISQKVRYYDEVCNSINEKTGKNIDTYEIYLLILSSLDHDMNSINLNRLDEFYIQSENIFYEYEPLFINNNTYKIFSDLKDEGVSMNILSNTGFIKGKTLRWFLDKHNIGDFFDFQIYSDECGFSKPNKKIFELLHNEISHIDKSKILHVGDNEIADCKGAIEFGFNGYLIKQ